MAVLVVQESPICSHQSIYNRNASIEGQLRNQRCRQLTIGITELHHSFVFVDREAIQYHAVVSRLFDRIVHRLRIVQVNGFRQDHGIGLCRRIRREDEFALVCFVTSTGLDVVVVAQREILLS